MDLLLDLAKDWNLQAEVTLEIPSLTPIPEDVWDWSQRAALRDAPRGATVRITNLFDAYTSRGWPLAVYESEAIRDGVVIESRIHAVCRVLDLGAIMVARAATPAAMASRREQIVTALTSARPDWKSDEVVSLHDLFDLPAWAGGLRREERGARWTG